MLKWFFPFAIIFHFANLATSLKIAIFLPDASNSQVIWDYRVAETLQKANHEVTIIRLAMAPTERNELQLPKGVTEWRFIGHNNGSDAPKVAKMQASAFEEMPLFSKKQRELLSFLGGMMLNGCKILLQKNELLPRLKAAKFDLAFGDMAGLCTVGLIHAAKIPTWIWMNNGPLLDYIADLTGMHSPSSYVPPLMSDLSDEMTFFQRVQSFIAWTAMPIVIRKLLIAPQTAMFREFVDPNFPELTEIAANCPLIMVNSDEMYALPRPILHKTIYIGGLGMTERTVKPLTREFKDMADKASNIIVFSLGSVANASRMPMNWKNAFLNSFRKFPDVEFIMRYDAEDLKGKLPPNVHIHPWLPQTDLIHLEKTRALITHGGYNSMQEAINAGTPLIVIPLFGDQPANARLAEKHKFGIALKKSEITVEVVTDAIKTILNDDSYTKSIKRTRDMVQMKPFKPDELLVRWTEFVATFKDLSNLTPYAVNLNSVKYYCVDVVIFLLTIVSILMYVSYRLLRFIFLAIFHRFKNSKRKTD